MKKVGVAAAVVVVVGSAWLGATAFTGQRIAAAYEARTAKLVKEFPFLNIVEQKSEKGFFSSTYSGKLRVGCARDVAGGKGDKPFVIGYTDRVQSGPFPGFKGFGAAVIESQITLPEELPEALRTYVAGMKPQDLRTTVAYGGTYKTALRLPAGQAAMSAGQFSWPDVHISGTGQLNGNAMSMEGHLPELTFRGDAKQQGPAGDANFKLVNLRWQSAQDGEGSLWLRPGKSQLDVERMEYTGKAGAQVVTAQLGKLKYATEVATEKELLSAKIEVTGNAMLKIGAAEAIQLDDIEFRESIKRLHGPTLQKLMEASTSDLGRCGEPTPAVAASNAASPGNAEDPEEAEGDDAEVQDPAAAARTRELFATLTELLPYTPEISVDKLAVSYAGRRGELSYSASVPGLTAQEAKDTDALRDVLQQKMVMRASAKLPVAWIEALGTRSGDAAGAQQRVAQANSMLDLAIGKGIAVREGDDVTATLLVERGVITVNGKPFGR